MKTSILAILIALVACGKAALPERSEEELRPDEMADVVAVAMTPSIAFPAPGELVDVAVQIQNRATHDERGVLVALYAGTARVAEQVVALESGATATVHLSWKAQAGTQTLSAQLDPNLRLIELDRFDNLTTVDLIVTERPSTSTDLALLDVTSVLLPNQSSVLRAKVRNNGAIAAKAPLVFTTDGQPAGVRLLEVPAHATVDVEVPLTAAQPPLQLSAELNPRYRSSEAHPDDNLLVKDLRPPVDLRIDGLSVSPGGFRTPHPLTISFRVVNAGALAIARGFRTSVSSTAPSPDGSPPSSIHDITTAALPPGGVIYVSHTIPAPLGEFDVRVEADADHAIAETDEANNTVVSHLQASTVGRWVSIGPSRIANGGLGAVGQLTAIAIDPVASGTLYVGGNGCGVWKTTDNGAHWQPIADALPSLAIAAIAIDPSATSRVYVATADAGVFRSEDNGTSWTLLPSSPNGEARWGALLVHPSNSSVLYLSSASGVQRSQDFGVSWQLVLPGKRVTDLVMDVTHPNVLYAGREGDGVHETVDGGNNWSQLTSGLPPANSPATKQVTLAICRNSPANVYAGYLTSTGLQLFRTADAGASWSLQSTPADSTLFNDVIGVDPSDPDFAYITGIRFFRRTSASTAFVPATGLHVDQHAFATDFNTGAIYALNDGGIYRSPDRGQTWLFIGEGISNVQFYDHALALQDPQLVIGGTQDNGTIRFDGTSTVWTAFKGGDGATVDIDPTNSNIQYAMNQGQESMARFVNGTQSCIGCSLPLDPVCFNLHFQVHPSLPSTLLASCASLWRANNPQCPVCPSPATHSSGTPGVWTVILPESMTAPGQVLRSTVDRTINLFYAGTSTGELWAGPAGANWRKVFHPNAPRAMTDVEVDPDNPAVLYASLAGAAGARVFRLQRGSASPTEATMASQSITSNLPEGLTIKTLALDRMASFTLYAGTDKGVFRGRSLNNGTTWAWTTYNDGLPAVDIRDLEIHPVSGILRAASFGRGAFEVNTEPPLGSLLGAEGKLTLLRVHDAASGFGPPTDFMDVEVVVALDSLPGRAFGFQLRPDSNRKTHRSMLNLLRDAFTHDRRVRIDYLRTGVRNGRIIRVMPTP